MKKVFSRQQASQGVESSPLGAQPLSPTPEGTPAAEASSVTTEVVGEVPLTQPASRHRTSSLPISRPAVKESEKRRNSASASVPASPEQGVVALATSPTSPQPVSVRVRKVLHSERGVTVSSATSVAPAPTAVLPAQPTQEQSVLERAAAVPLPPDDSEAGSTPEAVAPETALTSQAEIPKPVLKKMRFADEPEVIMLPGEDEDSAQSQCGETVFRGASLPDGRPAVVLTPEEIARSAERVAACISHGFRERGPSLPPSPASAEDRVPAASEQPSPARAAVPASPAVAPETALTSRPSTPKAAADKAAAPAEANDQPAAADSTMFTRLSGAVALGGIALVAGSLYGAFDYAKDLFVAFNSKALSQWRMLEKLVSAVRTEMQRSAAPVQKVVEYIFEQEKSFEKSFAGSYLNNLLANAKDQGEIAAVLACVDRPDGMAAFVKAYKAHLKVRAGAFAGGALVAGAIVAVAGWKYMRK